MTRNPLCARGTTAAGGPLQEAATKAAARRDPNATFVEQLNAFRAANAIDAVEAANAAGTAPPAAEEAPSIDEATTPVVDKSPAAANESSETVDESAASVEVAPVADAATDTALQSLL